MTLFAIRRTRVCIHPGLLLVLAAAYVWNMLPAFLLGALALSLHEWCHALVAHALGYRVNSVEFLPFGGVARLADGVVSPRAEFAIAMAGPVCSMVIAAVSGLMLYSLPILGQRLQQFMRLNLFLALFNLLPALPLDGGRMLRAVLQRHIRPRRATQMMAWSGILLAAILLGLCIASYFIGKLYPLPAIMGVFLLLSALQELRNAPQAKLSAMLRRQDAMHRGESLPIAHTAVPAGMRAAEALNMMSAGKYSVLRIVGADMRTLGELDEGALLNGVACHGMDITIERLIS